MASMTFSLVRVSFFLSGFTALIYQVIWQRALMRTVGASLPSTSIVFAGFMAGLAAGSLAGSILARKIRAPLRVYCLVELVIAVCGLTFLPAADGTVFGAMWQQQPSFFGILDLTRQVYAFFLVFVPTFLMGLTLPMVTSYTQSARPDRQREISLLYAHNLAGALFGALTAGFALVRLMGLDGSSWCAAAINLLVAALLAFVSAGSEPIKTVLPSTEKGESLFRIPDFGQASLLVFVNAFLCLSLEVVWSRQFSMLLGSSTYSISTVLGTVLCGLFFAAWMVPRLPPRLDELKLARICCLLVSLFLLAGLFLVELVPKAFVVIQQLFGGVQSLTSYVAPRAIICGAIIAPAALFSGSILPLMIRRFADRESATQCTAWLYSFSAIGAIGGALATGLVAIPLLSRKFTSGIESMLIASASAFALMALFLVWRATDRTAVKRAPLFFAASVLAVIPLAVHPPWNVNLMTAGIWGIATSAGGNESLLKLSDRPDPHAETLFYREGKNATVSVGSIPLRNIRFLKNDAKMEAAIPIDLRLPAPGSDLKTHTMLGLLPVLLHPGKIESSLVIGYGSGATSGALLTSSAVNRAVIAELEGCVYDANRFFVPSNGQPLRGEWLAQKRVSPMEIDGRYLLSSHPGTYDVIVSQPAEPWITGAADLYTAQFFELARRRLRDGGLFCQWVQLYDIDAANLAVLLRTFQQVFPSTFVFYPSNAGELILVGAKTDGSEGKFKIDVDALEERLKDPPVQSALVRVGLNNVYDVLSSWMLDSSGVSQFCKKMEHESGDARVNTDDNLILEYSLPHRVASAEGTIDVNLGKLVGDAVLNLDCLENYGQTSSEKAAFVSRLAFALMEQQGGVRAFENTCMTLAAEAIKISADDEQLAQLLVTQRFGGQSMSDDALRKLAASASSSTASLWFAEIFRERGKLDDAAGILRSAAKVSDQAVLHERLAKVYLAQKKYDLAFNEYSNTLETEPGNVEALTGAGMAAVRLNNYTTAETLLKRSLDLNPDRFDVQMTYGKVLCKAEKVEEGHFHVVQASRLKPDDPAPFVFVTAFYASRDDWKRAAANLELLQKRASTDKRTNVLSFIVYRGQGRTEEAEKFWRLYSSAPLPQNDKEVRRLIAELVSP